MNVLILVTTMLMLLALMTYARLDTYRSSQVFEILFENYMQQDERGYINMMAKKNYDSTKGSSRGGESKGQKIMASPRVSLSILLKKVERESAPQEVEHFKALLKNLMSTLYSDQEFYKEIQKQRASFVDEVIAAIVHSVDALPKDKRPKKASDLANLSLGDDQLDEVFYKMLHGAQYKKILQRVDEEPTQQNNSQAVESDEDQSDTSQVEKEAEEFTSPKGYFSLLDFITLQPVNKVRVYLASKEVLKAIFIDDYLVEDVMKKRKELFHEANLADEEGAKSLSESFKNEFGNREDPAVGETVLDFTVTKTNPSKYD